jgi:hypothetical protein
MLQSPEQEVHPPEVLLPDFVEHPPLLQEPHAIF